MNNLFGTIPKMEKTSGNPLYLSIANHVEKLIRQGKLSHGQKLPTTADFAKMFNVTVPTAQQSLSTLMGKGLLKRSTRLGTFINTSPMSKNIAVVFGHDPFGQQNYYIRQLLKYFGEIGDETALNISCHFTLSGSSFESQSRMLREDVKNGRYACIIPISGNIDMMKWVESQKDVPWIWPPEIDVQSMVHDGFSYLLGKGFGKIAFVSGESTDKYIIGQEYQGAWSAFAEKGLPMPGDMFKYWGESAESGCSQIKKLMSNKKSRPEALFISHDLLTKEALRGLDEMGLKIPDDIALLTHANKGDVFESRIPLTRMEIDPYEVAAATMNYIKNKCMYSQEKIESTSYRVPSPIRAKLVEGKSCGEK
ncbi:MAG: substrate-binding domain-containing protein [Victivallales bacterium]